MKPKTKISSPDKHQGVGAQLAPRLREGAFIALVGLALYLILALTTYSPSDPGWSFTGSGQDDATTNLVGSSGALVADVLLYFFGFLSYLFPMMLAHQAWEIFRETEVENNFNLSLLVFKIVGLLFTILSGTAISTMHFYDLGAILDFREGSGGVIGIWLTSLLDPVLSDTGTTLVLISMFLFGLTAFLDISWLRIMDNLGRLAIVMAERLAHNINRLVVKWQERVETKKTAEQRREVLEKHVEEAQERTAPLIEAPVPAKEPSIRVQKESQGSLFRVDNIDDLPALHLLDDDPELPRGYSSDDLEAMSRLLELKLKDYGVDAEVVAVFPGPVITRFEIQPAAGVKVSRISGLVKDIARSLAVISVRVVEVIPGKSVVGIEIPNIDRKIVRMSEVLKSRVYDRAASPLSLALGQDISGAPVVEDLSKMPHLLVAGTTGSGKSVGLNAMILSILFKASPEDVRMIMVDPKMLELAVYEGIPHLLTPVVTDMKDAANTLRWCVAEMERRYRLMSSLGVRNIAGFNRKLEEGVKNNTPLLDPLWEAGPLLEGAEQTAPLLEALPFIVVVIDEFADMIMIVGKKVEELIVRIAQKARAAGIHLILATQRPSVDVITGLIKANVPTRIAFQVSSKIDSRTILDQGGAEQLLGHGDMLYLPAGSPLPQRVHGAFVSDDEVHRVVNSWKKLGAPNYLNSVLEGVTERAMLPGTGMHLEPDTDEADPLYEEALSYVLESRRASISSVQRKLRVGYNRAARLIETMEVAGVVSPMSNNGSREVLTDAPPE